MSEKQTKPFQLSFNGLLKLRPSMTPEMSAKRCLSRLLEPNLPALGGNSSNCGRPLRTKQLRRRGKLSELVEGLQRDVAFAVDQSKRSAWAPVSVAPERLKHVVPSRVPMRHDDPSLSDTKGAVA